MARRPRVDWSKVKPSKADGVRIECNVTMRCNAECFGCNKAIGPAKFDDGEMTVEQMKKAVDQLLEQNIRVPRFTFCGGEPIMNKNLQGLINEVDRLPTLRSGRVLTNGTPSTQHLRDAIILPKRFSWIVNPLDDPNDPKSGKNDSKKRPNRRIHTPFWISPADIGKEADYDHCTVRGWCGVGLDSTGWSMCGKAAMFGKLFGVNTTIQEGGILEHVRTPMNEICRHCQYGLVGGKSEEKEIYKRYKNGELEPISPTFVQAFAQHKEQPLIQLRQM